MQGKKGEARLGAAGKHEEERGEAPHLAEDDAHGVALVLAAAALHCPAATVNESRAAPVIVLPWRSCCAAP